MRAMLLREIAPIEDAPLEWAELPDPVPGPREARLRVQCCAICRTDLHVIEGELPQHTLPIVPGHQIVGVVDQVGAECRRVRPGQRVGVAWLRYTCGQCEFCRSGRENLCPSAGFTGYHRNGGYAELAVVAEDFAYELPEVFDDASATPLLCAGIIGYRALERSAVRPGQRLALYGFGSSAHVVLQIARQRGCEVYVVSRTAEHRELARTLGSQWVGSNAAQMPVPAHSAIIFAPAGHLVPPALEQLEPGGTLALAGIYMSAVPALDYERHLFYEKNICSVTANTRADACNLLREAAEIPIRPEITRYPLREANRVLQDLKADRISGTGVLMVAGAGA